MSDISDIFYYIFQTIEDYFMFLVEGDYFYLVMPFICLIACFVIYSILKIIIKQVYK